MPIYKYKFCDGSEKEVEVSGGDYALLTAMDEREQSDNRRQERYNIPLETLKKQEDGGGKDGD